MVRVISFDIIRKTASQAKVELSNGDVYLVSFAGLLPYDNKDLYTKALERILTAFEKGVDSDLSNYVTYRMACEKLEVPLFVAPDRNRDRERIGQRIREIRMAKGMEARTLALRSQIDAANVSRIEQGKYSVGLDILCKIALALDSRVEIMPNWSYSSKATLLSMTRRTWVIPTLDSGFNPIATVPGCGFNLWPNTYDLNINIGDLAVFYLTKERRYESPFLISATNFQFGELGMYEWVFPELAKKEDTRYLKVEYHSHVSEADQIRIREACQRIKGEPTDILELYLQ